MFVESVLLISSRDFIVHQLLSTLHCTELKTLLTLLNGFVESTIKSQKSDRKLKTDKMSFNKQFVASLDQGTSSTRFMVFAALNGKHSSRQPNSPQITTPKSNLEALCTAIEK